MGIADGVETPAPLVTYALIAGMLVVSLATFIYPQLYDIVGGVGRLQYPWQWVTSAFEHGWPGVPLLPHLIGNLLLISIVGSDAERLLGSARYLVLTGLALVLYWATRTLTGLDATGASVFIWAYAPVVFFGQRYAYAKGSEGRHELAAILIVMWIIIPFGMGILVSLSSDIAPLIALPIANAFHISGTVAGSIGTWVWKDEIGVAERQPSAADRFVRYVSVLIPVSLAALLVFVWVTYV